MTTFADLIAETRHRLMTARPDRLNVLDLDINNSTASVQVRYQADGIDNGTILCVDLEEMYVLSISGIAAGSIAIVIRGFNGSTPVAHTAGTPLMVSPNFSDFHISKYVNRGLEDLSIDLFQIKSVEFDFNPAVYSYELTPTDLIDVWRVRFDSPGPDKVWTVMNPSDWYIDLAANTTDFPSGRSITFRRPASAGFPVRVSYRAGFTALSTVTDNVLTISGLHTEAHDLPPLYAAYMLANGREIQRSLTTQQPERRRQEEVPPGSARMGAQEMALVYQSRIVREAARLKRRYNGAI